MSPAVISRKVDVPARFEELVASAEAELGSFGEHCQI